MTGGQTLNSAGQDTGRLTHDDCSETDRDIEMENNNSAEVTNVVCRHR